MLCWSAFQIFSTIPSKFEKQKYEQGLTVRFTGRNKTYDDESQFYSTGTLTMAIIEDLESSQR